MPNAKNTQIVAELKDKIKNAKSIVFADYRGLKADDISTLRSQIRENDAEVVVAKNTLLKTALKEENVDVQALERDLKGPTTAIFSYKDAILPIKTLVEFAKKLELPKIKSAVIEGSYADSAKVEEVSKIPSKKELIARMIGGFKSPLSGLTNTLGGVQRKFVYAINAIKNSKEGGVQE